MLNRVKFISSAEEWEQYRRQFATRFDGHRPGFPPSLPVLVFSHVRQEQDCHDMWDDTVEHCFVEVVELKKFLGVTGG